MPPILSSAPAVDNPMEAPQAPLPLPMERFCRAEGGSMWASALAIVIHVFGPFDFYRNDPENRYEHNSLATKELLRRVHDIPEDFASVGVWM